MTSRKGGGGNTYMGSASAGNFSPKGKSIEGYSSGPNVEQLSRDMAAVDVDPTQEGEWEVIGKKSKNRPAPGSAPRAWGGQSGNMTRQAWGTNGGAGRASGNNWAQSGNGGAGRAAANSYNSVDNWAQESWPPATESQKPVGRGFSKHEPEPQAWESAYMAKPRSAVPPSLQNGWEWGAKHGSSGSQANSSTNNEMYAENYDAESDLGSSQPNDEVSDDEEVLEDSDGDLSDEYDSDASEKSHETRKNNKWFKAFFEALDRLTVAEVTEPSRQWHCPACKNGPGAIDWYTGLQPLISHAKTKGAKRTALHRELAKLLEEELQRRGTSAVPAGEAYGKWRGLRETTNDYDIVWPPMVVVMNTQLERDENEKWVGMGNQELLEYFSQYKAVKARHSYGPRGHRGISLLIFEPNVVGYLEAERLHKHFQEQGTDKDAWERRRVLFYPGGKRQLYGYLASKEDMESFNQHCHGKTKLKYEMKSYQEMVVMPMKQMSEDNQQLNYLKNKVVKVQQRSKALEETFDAVSQKLRETMEENRIVRLRTKKQYEENKEEMDYQEQFFKEQMAKVQRDIEAKEEKYENLFQQERAKAKQSVEHSKSKQERRRRNEEIQRFIDSQAKGVEEFEAERDKLIHVHEEKKAELRRKYFEEEVELEKSFDDHLTKLMEKYSPSSFTTSSGSS